MPKPTSIAICCILAWLFLCAGSVPALAEDDQQSIAESQQRVSEKYDRLELLAGRLAELSSSTQPRRARLLREFVSQSRERDLTGRFADIIQSLEQEKLASALKNQDSLQGELEQLLELLLQEDRDTQIEAERKRIARYLAQLEKLIRKQSGIKARTEGRDDQQELTDDQQQAAEDAGSLSENIQQTEGAAKGSKSKPSDNSSSKNGEGEPTEPNDGSQDSSEQNPQQGKSSESSQSEPSDSSSQGQDSQGQDSQSSPAQKGSPSQSGQSQGGQSSEGKQSPQDSPEKPADRAADRLQKAQQRMQQALDKLKEAEHSDAIEAQQEALRELEQAKAELEKILRQLREEEKERMLVLLEARFRKMLDAQIAVYEQTKQLDVERAQIEPHELAIGSARLSRKEKQIVREADRALVLLREDGTSVAFPVAIEQAKEDMESVAKRLSDVKIAAITQALEEDIIAALEETLAAVQQALQEMRDKKSQPQQGGGQPSEQPLVDQLAELRMIRALQNRINRRTVLYGNMIEGEQAMEAELLEALDELAQREECVYRATLDLHQEANQ